MDINQEVEGYLKKLPPAPADVERWIRKEVIDQTYLIYKNKTNEAVCTRCGMRFHVSKIPDREHNAKGYCPYCNRAAEFKAEHHKRKSLKEQFRILLLTRKGKTVYGTLFEIDADFTEFGIPAIRKWLSALYVFTEKERKYFKCHPAGYWTDERWECPKEVNLPSPPCGYNWGGWSSYERTEIYPYNLRSVFEQSCLHYHYDAALFREFQFEPRDYVRYIDQCLKYKSMELLRKAGFQRIVADRVRKEDGRALYIRGESLVKILRTPKRWHKKIREYEMSAAELRQFQRLSEKDKGIVSKEQLSWMIENGLYQKEIEQYVPMIEAARYLIPQKGAAWEYRDYLRMADQLGHDMKRKQILFPKKLQESHDAVMEAWEGQKSEIEAAEMRKRFEAIKAEFPEYQEGSLLIRAAESQEELNQESQGLGHCVRTYTQYIKEGTSKIFFIRKIEAPDVPFYTLELNKRNELIQCRGKKNCNTTKEIDAFIERWRQQSDKQKKKGAA